MGTAVEDRLEALGLILPSAAAPAANYLPFARHGDLIFVSGQLCIGPEGLTIKGKLGDNVTLADGQQAARLCAMNILAQAKAALDGDLERVRQIIRITGFVASAPGFTDQHLVVNGASDLLVDVLGERGRHSRAAVGMACLPLDAAVEIDAVIAAG
ncbi:MAG TPA: RidA family protein [Afifellaceae bacterium]|nr:RidA family protein [Afifellaceae bacterium]